MNADHALATRLLATEVWFRQAEYALDTDPDRMRELLTRVFSVDLLLTQNMAANARSMAAAELAGDLAAQIQDLRLQADRLEARLLRLAEMRTDTRGMRDRVLPAESLAGPAAGGAHRAGPTGTSGESQTGEVPVGQGVLATANRAEISRTGGVAQRPTDIPNAEVETASRPVGKGLRIVG